MTHRAAALTVPRVARIPDRRSPSTRQYAMDSPDPTPTLASRWGAAAGIGFAVLTLYALVGPPWPPRGDAPAGVWQAHLASAPNRLGLIAGAIAGVVGGVLFIAFMASLRKRGLLVL